MTIADIVSEINNLCDSDATSYIAADKLRRINNSYEEEVGKLISNNETWQFDDTNFTDLPIGKTTLVNAQQDYSFDSTFLEIEEVSVQDVNGLWYKLNPIDKAEMGVDPDEFYKVAGLPLYYDKQGSSIFLYPAPATGSVTMANGLKVFFLRTAAVFTSAEVSIGTKQPGFASPYHVLLAYKAALPYCVTYKPQRVALIESEIMRLEKGLMDFYSRREKDVQKRLIMSQRTFR